MAQPIAADSSAPSQHAELDKRDPAGAREDAELLADEQADRDAEHDRIAHHRRAQVTKIETGAARQAESQNDPG